jgi:GDP-L-fucose synthase
VDTMFKGKNVLVTGGAGFVGTNLIKRLLDLDANIRATLHKKDAAIKDPRIEYIRCDLRRPEDCKRVTRDMDYVFLCAANTEKVLFISSNTVYPVTDYPVKESDVTNEFFEKYFIVAWMKRFTEIACEMYSTKIKDPMQTVVVRPANIYGPYDDFEWETSHVLPALIRKVVERHDPIEVWGDGKDLKDFIYIDDAVEGMLLAMEKLNEFEPINLASGKQYVLNKLLQTIIEIDGFKEARIVHNTSKPSMISKRLIDPSKAKMKIGFKAKTSMEEGLKRTIEWYRSTL